MKQALILAGLIAAAVLLVSQTPPSRELLGPQPDGRVLLPNGWRLSPIGRPLALDTFPMSSVVSRDGKTMFVLNQGYNPPSISAIDIAGEKELSRTPVSDGWLGLALNAAGDRLYVGGGARASVFEFEVSGSALKAARTFTIVPEAGRTAEDFTGDVTLSPDGRLIYAAELYRDAVAVINPQSGTVIERFKTGRRPYRIVFHPDGKSLFVTSWADGTLYHHEAETGRQLSTLRVGPGITDMIWRRGRPEDESEEARYTARLFITASNTNSVYSIGVSESKELTRLETINVSLTPRQPVGMTPSALALSPDEKQLYIVCSDANAVAIADVSSARTSMNGFFPTAWYPVAVRTFAGKVVVFNGRGPRSFPNPQGPNPSVRPAPTHEGIVAVEYVGRIQRGSALFVDNSAIEDLDPHTAAVVANSPYRDELLDDAKIPAGNPIPSSPGVKSPIEHVIYVIKENRTYHQVLGDLKEGNGDPSLVLFGADAGPNHRKLAREFVLLDNFYVNSDVSADGHNWSTAAIAPLYVQKMWPNSYGGRRKKYDYEGGEPAAVPPAGYLWTNAMRAGVSVRNFGFQSNNTPKAGALGEAQITGVRDPALAKVTSMKFRAFDLDYLDVDRVKVVLDEVAEWEQKGEAPRLILVRIGNDHTSGTSAGKYSPRAAFADNDYALGLLVEGVSKSKMWPKTAIFVLEDDAQNGPDHVDSHRAPAYVISPYVKRKVVDSTMYNTTSMLRTMELILGLRPMTQFDAGARPMWSAFTGTPDTTPYSAVKPTYPMDERNPANTATARRSARLDFSKEDAIDDDELNDILWRALKTGEPPAPVRSAFAR